MSALIPARFRLNSSKWKVSFSALAITCLIFFFYSFLLALLQALEGTFKASESGAEFWPTFGVLANIAAALLALLALYFFVKYFQRRRLHLAFHAIKKDHIVSLFKNFFIHFGLAFILSFVILLFNWGDFFDIPSPQIENVSFSPQLWFLLLVMAVPIFEEVLFRGFFYARLRRVFKFWPAFLCSGLFFSLLHMRPELTLVSNIYIVLNILLLTYFITKTFEESKNLWMPILFHACHNGRVLLIILAEPFF